MTLYTKNEDGSVVYTAEQHAAMEMAFNRAITTAGLAPMIAMVTKLVETAELTNEQREEFSIMLNYLGNNGSNYMWLSAIVQQVLLAQGIGHYALQAMEGRVGAPNEEYSYSGVTIRRIKEILAQGNLAEAGTLLLALHVGFKKFNATVNNTPMEMPKFTFDLVREPEPVVDNPAESVDEPVSVLEPVMVPVAEPIPV